MSAPDPAPGDEMPAEMDHLAQNEAFHKDLKKTLHRYRQEFDLSLPAALGILQIMQFELLREFEEANRPPPTDTDT